MYGGFTASGSQGHVRDSDHRRPIRITAPANCHPAFYLLLRLCCCSLGIMMSDAIGRRVACPSTRTSQRLVLNGSRFTSRPSVVCLFSPLSV